MAMTPKSESIGHAADTIYEVLKEIEASIDSSTCAIYHLSDVLSDLVIAVKRLERD